jgi:hypothetical protein
MLPIARGVKLNREATAMQQSAEWGMRAIQSLFPCLKDCFIYEEYGKQKIILKLIILLNILHSL